MVINIMYGYILVCDNDNNGLSVTFVDDGEGPITFAGVRNLGPNAAQLPVSKKQAKRARKRAERALVHAGLLRHGQST